MLEKASNQQQIPIDPEDISWHLKASCLGVDPDLFFSEVDNSTTEAKSVCGGCVVREQCLEYALATNEQWGVWGGLSRKERRTLTKIRLGTNPTMTDSDCGHINNERP